MKNISKTDVYSKLTPRACIKIMQETLSALEKGEAEQYLRTITPLPEGGLMGYMPAALPGCFGAKLITVFHSNAGTAYPSHQGSVLLFDSANGSLIGMADGGAITEIRTGAVSAVATDILANQSAHALALLGAGVQAKSHLLAIKEVRKLTEVTVWDMREENAQQFAVEMAKQTGLSIKVCATAQEAVQNADIICTVTASKTPILEKEWVKQGVHINAVGACAKSERELSSALVAAGEVYCDSIESVFAEGGDFLIPRDEGLFDDTHLRGTIGGLLVGKSQGRITDDEITIFEALGLAVEDVACANYLCNL